MGDLFPSFCPFIEWLLVDQHKTPLMFPLAGQTKFLCSSKTSLFLGRFFKFCNCNCSFEMWMCLKTILPLLWAKTLFIKDLRPIKEYSFQIVQSQWEGERAADFRGHLAQVVKLPFVPKIGETLFFGELRPISKYKWAMIIVPQLWNALCFSEIEC
jgi:hypothetical protein